MLDWSFVAVVALSAGVLDGLRVLEGSAFVAAPLGEMTLAQLGADVIRFDPIGGGLDRKRWPVTADGHSLFWAGLNKGKRSIQIDLGSEEGRELVTELIAAPGPEKGLFLTNFPARGFLDYVRLSERRPDLIMINIVGNHDGSSAVDYTVNPATGFAWATGPRNLAVPFNHLLPAWDAITGALATTSLLAAERCTNAHRRRAVRPDRRSPTWPSGWSAASARSPRSRSTTTSARRTATTSTAPLAATSSTKDGHRVMIVALTLRQWHNLVKATGLGEAFDAIARLMDVDLDDEGGRFVAREVLGATLKPWVLARTLEEVRRHVRPPRRLVGPLPDIHRARRARSPLLAPEPDVRRSRPTHDRALPRCPARRSPSPTPSASHRRPRPMLGEHTDDVLAGLLGLSDREIGALHERGVVAGPATS